MIHRALLGLLIGAFGAGAAIVVASVLAPVVDLMPPGPEVGEAVAPGWSDYRIELPESLPLIPMVGQRLAAIGSPDGAQTIPSDLHATTELSGWPTPDETTVHVPPFVSSPLTRPEVGVILESLPKK